jgi:septal ring factor EnvC (AmiA/AmiB activator)
MRLWLPLALLLLSFGGAAQAAPVANGDFDGAIRATVALAHEAQQRERAVDALEGGAAAAAAELAAKQHELDASRARQQAVLAALERLAYAPPEVALLAGAQPIDRLRGGRLIAAAIPALADEARRLGAEIDRLTALKAEAAAKQGRLAQDRQALAKTREQLAAAVARRVELRRELVRDDPEAAARALKLGGEATDLPDLIRRADAEAERRDREAHQRAAVAGKGKAVVPPADPTRPKTLRNFDPHDALSPPVGGKLSRRFGETDAAGMPSQGLAFAARGNAPVLAPFDGRVDYVGPFRGYGLVLIIGHGGGYHSLLAGLGRADARIGEWVVAGEPIGTMSEPAKTEAAVTLYFELRHDGRPIDPQLSLATVQDRVADHRVRE